MIGTALALQFIELCGWGALWMKVKSDVTKQILIHGRPQPQRIPIVDTQLRQMAGHPTHIQRVISRRFIKIARKVVNTRAFEYIVAAAANPKSSLRKRLKKPTVIRIE